MTYVLPALALLTGIFAFLFYAIPEEKDVNKAGFVTNAAFKALFLLITLLLAISVCFVGLNETFGTPITFVNSSYANFTQFTNTTTCTGGPMISPGVCGVGGTLTESFVQTNAPVVSSTSSYTVDPSTFNVLNVLMLVLEGILGLVMGFIVLGLVWQVMMYFGIVGGKPRF